MKNIKFILASFLLIFSLSSCEDEDGLIFTARPDSDGISFSNSFSSEYLLSDETSSNIAERFIWNSANFDAPVNVTYEVHGSIDPTFEEFDIIGSTSETNLGITVEELLTFAFDLGLDDDPATTTETGSPNNTGQVFFRLRAFTGAGSANTVEMMSEPQPLTITIIERTEVSGCDPFYVVGAGAVDAGWDWDSPIEFACDSDVRVARMELTNDNFRFFTTEGDWGSGLNYPYFEDLGYTIDPLFENAEDGDSNFSFVGTPGIYEVIIDDNDRTITVNPSSPFYLVGAAIVQTGWSWDNRAEVPEVNAYVFRNEVELTNEAFRFFTVDGDWGSGLNYPYFVDEGYTIDERFENAEDGDSNFSFVGDPGTYTLTVNMQEKTITLE